METPDIVIVGSMNITKGSTLRLSYDFEDRGVQPLVVTTSSISIFEEDGTPTQAANVPGEHTLGANFSLRVEFLLSGVITGTFNLGNHFAIIGLVLQDTQTRRARASLRVNDSVVQELVGAQALGVTES